MLIFETLYCVHSGALLLSMLFTHVAGIYKYSYVFRCMTSHIGWILLNYQKTKNLFQCFFFVCFFFVVVNFSRLL